MIAASHALSTSTSSGSCGGVASHPLLAVSAPHAPCRQARRQAVGGNRPCVMARVQPPLSSAVVAMDEAVPVEDVRFATLLSELVYRAADCTDEVAFHQAQAAVEQELGACLSHVRRHKSGGQRYLVGETETAIYVAFQGTKSATDWLANLNFFHGHFGFQRQPQDSSSSGGGSGVSDRSFSSASSAASVSSRSSSVSSASSTSSSARAHIGFLRRANSAAVSISSLHAAAAAAGKRLVLTGHSLGGAVAVLTTVRLLRALTTAQLGSSSSSSGLHSLLNAAAEPLIRCISFATPAVANTDLLQEVMAAGWDQFITNIVMPEDPVVPFVNLLLKAPPSPSNPKAKPRSLFRAPDSPGSPASDSSSSTYSINSSPALTRSSSSSGSQLSGLDSSWGRRLQFEPLDLPVELTAGLAPAGSAATAALQPLQDVVTAAADGPWGSQQLPELAFALASPSAGGALELGLASLPASPTSAALVGSGSHELASWLAAAQRTVKACGSGAPSQRSFAESRDNSISGNSLYSLQYDLWPASSVSEPSSSGHSSPTSPASRSRSDSGVSYVSRPGSPTAGLPSAQQEAPTVPDSLLVAALAAAEQEQQQQQPAQGTAPIRSQFMHQVKRLQQQLGGSKATTRAAWIGGALAASLRCASAFAAVPGMVSTPQLSLLTLLPRALFGPAAFAALHFVGHAAYKAAMPASHPLGQQWVMTGSGLELVVKPLHAYPRSGEGLGLKELGGLFPGHRMIAYRRRLAVLVSQAPPSPGSPGSQ